MKWTAEKLKEEALKYKTRGEFNKSSKGAYLSAYRAGTLDKVCAHMGALTHSWTEKEVKKEALKYDTRYEFQKKSKGAYLWAYRRGILNKICKHMEWAAYPWTNEELEQEAFKYSTRYEFQIKMSGAYVVARNRGIIDQICKHMPIKASISRLELELLKEVKTFYPNAKKLKDYKVKIPTKSHIKRFEIDIYIPELCKGIEFDGTYWHSFNVMKKDRKKLSWPEEDIRNYHEIKDEYFFSKGIEIIHIKEKDWLENKNQSLNKVLDFLRK